MLWLFVHVTQCVCFLGSAVASIYPTKLPKLRNAAAVGHLLLGSSLLLVPGYFLAITVQGRFNTLHAFLQAYSAPFHLGLAYFLLSPSGLPRHKPFVFAQAFCALLSLLTKLLSAWHLTEKSARGLLISDHFVLCAFLTDGAWLINEVVNLVANHRTKQDEIDQMCRRTTLWLEGKGSFYLENAFYIDTALCLLTAFMHFAFPQHILKLVHAASCFRTELLSLPLGASILVLTTIMVFCASYSKNIFALRLRWHTVFLRNNFSLTFCYYRYFLEKKRVAFFLAVAAKQFPLQELSLLCAYMLGLNGVRTCLLRFIASITSEYTLDSHHIMWCRMFGCLSVLPALSSLSARHLPPHVQIHYLGNRLITQVLIFVLNVFGHWALSIYSPNHISGFMISGFFMSFLFSTFYRANSHYQDLPESLHLKPKSL